MEDKTSFTYTEDETSFKNFASVPKFYGIVFGFVIIIYED